MSKDDSGAALRVNSGRPKLEFDNFVFNNRGIPSTADNETFEFTRICKLKNREKLEWLSDNTGKLKLLERGAASS